MTAFTLARLLPPQSPLALGLGSAACGEDDDTAKTRAVTKPPATAGDWRPWVLESGAEVRVPPPPAPGSAAEKADRGRLREAKEKATQEEEQVARAFKAGRPNSNGCAERVQLTVLEECWRPALARPLAPKITALRRDLDEYLTYYNTDRAHSGRHTNGHVPADIVHGAHKMRTRR